MIHSLSSLMIEPQLIAKCLIGDDVKAAFGSAFALCCTSKVYRFILNSDRFFQDFVQLIDPQHPLLMKESQEKTSQSLRHKFFDLRSSFLLKNEIFEGAPFAEALVGEDGVEIISFHDQIISRRLKENSTSQEIKIPEAMRIPARDVWRESPYAARSEKFLAINARCDSAVYIYTPDGEEFLAKYEVVGGIFQLTIVGNLLCIVEQKLRSRNLVIFNLESSEDQDPVTIALPNHEKLWPPPRPICFGEECLIYTQNLMEGNQIYALPLSYLHTATEGSALPWIKGTPTKNKRYMFPDGDHFIAVTFKECYICDISKVIITSEGFRDREIAKDICISTDEAALCTDVCFCNDRVFFAYDNFCKETKLFSYDILSNEVTQLTSTSESASNCPFKPRFLKTATNIYYLMMGLRILTTHTGQIAAYLTTLTYGKI